MLNDQLNLMLQGKFALARKICEKIDKTINKTDKDYNAHQFNKGWFTLYDGNLQEGFKLLDFGRNINVYGNEVLKTTKPIWRFENLKNKTVILNLEGGSGDQIIFARFAQNIKTKKGRCVICCDKELHSLLQRVKGVSKCITQDEIKNTDHDYWIPSFSSPWLFNCTWKNLYPGPYMTVDSEYNDIWKNNLKNKKIKIGIRWAGFPYFEHHQLRLFPPQRLINLSKYSQLQIYSLQRDSNLIELPDNIADLRNDLTTWEDTAAVINNLDLVITSCTSIAHLASAMGKPTWVIVPILPYYTWTYGDKHSPWYGNTTKIYRPKSFGKWNDVFDNIEKDLIKLFNLEK